MTRRWRGWALYAAAWLPVLIGYAALLHSMQGVPLRESWLASANYTSTAALLGVVVWYLSARLSWPDQRLGVFVVQQGILAMAFATLWLAAILLYLAARIGLTRATAAAATFASWQMLSGFWVYGVIAGVSYALRVTGRLREREAVAARAEAQRMHAELHALRGQLNPHFLFNTLHTVSALASQSPARAQDAVERLADLLRYVLDAKRFEREEVTLAEELAFVRDYLSLEQLRLGERLVVHEEIDEDALEMMIPSLTLQPLVENAIRHAVEPRAGGGTVAIVARVEGEAVVLRISDNGPGAAGDVHLSQGVGLRAVRQRIATRYGARGTFEVITRPGDGFSVRLSLPARTASGITAEMRVVTA